MPATWIVRQRDWSIAQVEFSQVADAHPLNNARITKAEETAAAAVTANANKKGELTHDDRPTKAQLVSDPLLDDPLGAAAVNDDPLGAAPVSVDPLSGDGSGRGGGSRISDSNSGTVLLAGGTQVSSAATSTTARVAGWKEKRALIIKQYAAAGQLKVSSALLDADGVAANSLGSNIDEAGPSGEKKVTLDTKTRRRLEQLETQEEDGKIIRLTQVTW